VPGASLEEQEEEEEEDEDLPLTPQLIPQGSGGSGVLMGPDTQKGLKQHTPKSFESLQFTGFKGGPRSSR